MSVTTYEAIVKNGQIRLPDDVSLPENAMVYVLVPGLESQAVPHLRSPRLADPRRMVDFKKRIIAGNADAEV